MAASDCFFPPAGTDESDLEVFVPLSIDWASRAPPPPSGITYRTRMHIEPIVAEPMLNLSVRRV
jgi:hypothetical protein